MGKLLCRLGLHLWHKHNGRAIEVGGRIVGAAYDRRCLRCHKIQRDMWLPL